MKKLIFILLCFCLMTFGSSARIIEVAPAGAWGVLGISGGGAVAAGGGGQNFYDGFAYSDGDLETVSSSVWVKGESGNGSYTVASSVITTNETNVYLYQTSTDTLNQWAIWKGVTVDNYAGAYFRSDGNMANTAYTLRNNEGAAFAWRYCTGSSCNDFSQNSHDMSDNDYVGARISGTGTGTVVYACDFGATTPNSCATASDCNPDNVDWATYGTCYTWIDDPGANEAINGYKIGMYTGSDAAGSFDDFYGGDWTP